jgi:hypothetical protein
METENELPIVVLKNYGDHPWDGFAEARLTKWPSIERSKAGRLQSSQHHNFCCLGVVAAELCDIPSDLTKTNTSLARALEEDGIREQGELYKNLTKRVDAKEIAKKLNFENLDKIFISILSDYMSDCTIEAIIMRVNDSNHLSRAARFCILQVIFLVYLSIDLQLEETA